MTLGGLPAQNFADVLERSVNQVDAKVNQADLEVRKLAVGEEGDLHRHDFAGGRKNVFVAHDPGSQ